MPENEWLAQQFEAHRTDLQRVAYQMLGSQERGQTMLCRNPGFASAALTPATSKTCVDG